MSTSVDQSVTPPIGFYQPSFIFPFQVTVITQGFGSIQFPITQDVTRRVNIPSAVLCTGLTLTVFSTCLMRNVRRPPFGSRHRSFTYTAGYPDFVNLTAVNLAGKGADSDACDSPSSSTFDLHNPQEIAFTWLEHPVDYVPHKMDLFAESKIPFGARPALFCPKDAEHEEKAFDLLRYRHAFKQFGVPSVSGRASLPPRPIGSRVLGNTSSVYFSSDINSSHLCAPVPQGGLSICDYTIYNAPSTVSVYLLDPFPPVPRFNGKEPIFRWSTIGLGSLLLVFGLLLAWHFHVDLSNYYTCFDFDGKDIPTLERHELDIITGSPDSGSMVRWKGRSLSSIFDAVSLSRDRLDLVLSTKVLYETTINSSQFLLRAIIFGIQLVVYLCLHFVAFSITGRFGWRSLAGLIREYRGSKAPRRKRCEKKRTTSSPYMEELYYYDYYPSDYVIVQFVETPVEQVDGQAPVASEFEDFTFWYITGLHPREVTTRTSVLRQTPKQRMQHQPATNVGTSDKQNSNRCRKSPDRRNRATLVSSNVNKNVCR